MAVTRTKNGTYKGSVEVNLHAGDYISYQVTVRGATPGTFSLIDGATEQEIWSSADTPTETSPNFVYIRKWPMPGDIINTNTNHAMGFQFIGVRDVNYVVKLHRLIGSPKQIMDIDYKATDDDDDYPEDLVVTTFTEGI